MPKHPDEGPKRRFVLPFATPSAKRPRAFTKNMERAAILYIAESNRKKGESHVLKKKDEKIVFISEACYPIWLIPHGGATLLFDGLGLTSHVLSYDVIPDIEVFNENIRENSKATEAYAAALARNVDYFRSFIGTEERRIEGLITNSDFIKDFKTYLPEMKRTRRRFTTKVTLTATIEECDIQAAVEELSNLRKKTRKDIESIDGSMKLLNTTTERRIKAIREEIRKSQKRYSKQIERIRPKVKRKILQINRKYTLKIARKAKRFKKRLQILHGNQIKLEATLRHLKTEAKKCETRMDHSRKGKEIQWSLKLERIEKKLPTLKEKIEKNIKRLRNVEDALKLEVARQKTGSYEQVEAVNKIFLDLQASRDAEITMKRREIATLTDLTSHIMSLMQEMIQTKRVFLKEFDELIKSGGKWRRGLVYIPFYITRYEKGDKKRYVVYPPSTVGNMGILTKMKGALGAAKVKALLQSRSMVMTTFLNKLAQLIEKNPMLEKDITEAGIEASVVLKKRLRVGVKKGLKGLEKENWISKNELEAFSKLLYIYTGAAQQ